MKNNDPAGIPHLADPKSKVLDTAERCNYRQVRKNGRKKKHRRKKGKKQLVPGGVRRKKKNSWRKVSLEFPHHPEKEIHKGGRKDTAGGTKRLTREHHVRLKKRMSQVDEKDRNRKKTSNKTNVSYAQFF